MNSSTEFLQHIRRRWWWSEEPFWKYLDTGQRGWANLVDDHPGLFNLAWLMAEVSRVPTDFFLYSTTTQWVFENGQAIKCQGETLADLAFKYSMYDFTAKLRKSRVKLPNPTPRSA